MVDTKKLVKNKLLYVIRNEKGEIDNSDIFLLDSVCKICDKIKVILCGDFCLENVCDVLEKYSNEIIIRDSKECDLQIVGDEILFHEYDGYDELLFLNNSVFGPFYSVYDIVNVMREKDFDFWGLTKKGEIVTDQWEYVPEHLQLYFFAVGRKMLYSLEMLEFFRQKKLDMVFDYEFTSHFENCGFRWGTYINISKYDSDSVARNIDLLYEACFELVAEHGFPFLKKDYFTRKSLLHSNGTDLKCIVDFLINQGLYNVDMIWDCVLRKYNIAQIKDSMNLNYILPSVNRETMSIISVNDYNETAIIMHLAYEESIVEIYRYVIEIPKEIKKFFVVINKELKQCLKKALLKWNCENFEIRVMYPNRGRDMNSLFVVCRDVWQKYTYLCFTHDKKTSGESASYIVGKEFMNILWDNTLKSHEYIADVLALLKNQKRLGYLSVPAPYHASYCGISLARAWTSSYDITRELAEKMHLEVDISKEFLPFALGNAFWCKTAALQDITDYHLETNDFCEEPMPIDGTISHALERIMIYAAQNRGYYSGIVENAEYAQTELNNKNYMLNQMIQKIFVQTQFCGDKTFSRIIRLMSDTSFSDFLNTRKKLYIWGAGKTGKELARELEELDYTVQGYICSDGYEKPQNCNKAVYYLSEIECNDPEVGIIIAVHKKFYKDLKQILKGINQNAVYYSNIS